MIWVRVIIVAVTSACLSTCVSFEKGMREGNIATYLIDTARYLDELSENVGNETASNHNGKSEFYASFLDEKAFDNSTSSRNKRELQFKSRMNDVEDRGKKHKMQKMLIKIAVALKMISLGFVLPGVVAFNMLQSWKAVTISLLAFGLAAVVGIKNLVKGSSTPQVHPPAVLPISLPASNNHHHVWRTLRVEPPAPIIVAHEDHNDILSSHELAYRKHQPT